MPVSRLATLTFRILLASGAGIATQRVIAEDRVDARADRPQVAAATAEAVASMRAQIERAPFGRTQTVGDVIRRCRGAEELDNALNRAEMIGGPRWIDNDTCQVQLEMSGTRVARIVEHIVNAHKDQVTASKDELDQLATDWQRRTFSGSGSSTAFARAARVRPRLSAGSPWSTIPEAERQKLYTAAKEDAVNRVVDSIKPIEISKGKTVGDALSQAEVRKAVMEWLAVRPVVRVDYHADLQIEITMAGTPNGLFDVVRHAVIERSDLPIPRNEAEWSLVRRDFQSQMASPVGRATAAGASTLPANAVDMPRPRFTLPPRAPDWVGRHVDVEAYGDRGTAKLKGAREAEAAAKRKLVVEINALPLSKGVTVGQAAESDPRVRDAVSGALDKARTVNTDYTHKDGVSVSLQLDLQDVWDAIRAAE